MFADADHRLDDQIDAADRARYRRYSTPRKSLPSLLMASRDLTRVLKDRYPGEQAAQAYIDQLTSLGPADLISSSRRCLAVLRKLRGPEPRTCA